MKITILNPETLTTAWVVNQLDARVKPSIAGLTWTVFVKGTYKLVPGGVATAPDDRPDFPTGDDPVDGDPKLGLKSSNEFVPFKPRGEFTVSGTAYAPGGVAVGMFPVVVRVGGLEKRLRIYGEREWKSGVLGATPGQPKPIDRLLLTYAKAWGGKKMESNPLGIGQEDAAMHQIEREGVAVTARRDDVAPAGLGPIPPDWKVRRDKLGTYDDAWTASRWPWLPLDFDWSFFNAAPADQCLEAGYFRGDEALSFTNLHPGHPQYDSRLPGIRARFFYSLKSDDGVPLREVPMDLDTIHADLDSEKLLLVWRGRVEAPSLKLNEIGNVLVVSEELDGEAGTVESYEAKLDEVLNPPEPPKPPAEEPFDFEGMKKEIEKLVEEKMKQLEQYEKMALEQKAQVLKAAEAAKGSPIDLPVSKGVLGDMEGMLDQLRATPGIPQEQIDKYAGAIPEVAALMKERNSFEADFAAAEQKILAQIPSYKPKLVLPKLPNGKVDLAAAKVSGLAGADLTGADFSGMDLSGMDFSGAQVSKANFAGCTMERAKWGGVSFNEADLTDANFGHSDLSNADFSSAKIGGAGFEGANVTNANFAGLDLGGIQFSGVHGSGVNFTGAKLVGSNFAGANLPFALFTQADVTDANFGGANLNNANFHGAVAVRTDFRNCDLTRFRAGMKCNFSDADLRSARGENSVWKGGEYQRANFQCADLSDSHFQESILDGAIFDRCDLTDASFEDASARQTLLTNANLLRCLFNRTDLRSAKLDGSNIYSAGMWDADLTHATWENANVKNTRLAP